MAKVLGKSPKNFHQFHEIFSFVTRNFYFSVVGGGITSAATAAFMKEKLREINLTIFDKARGAGGRMSTSRSPNNSECTADLGAQYISVSPEYGLKQK